MPGMEIVTVPNKGVRSLQNRCQEWSCFAGLDSSFWKCCPPCFHSELKFGRAIALESWQVSVQTISLLTLTPHGRGRERVRVLQYDIRVCGDPHAAGRRFPYIYSLV